VPNIRCSFLPQGLHVQSTPRRPLDSDIARLSALVAITGCMASRNIPRVLVGFRAVRFQHGPDGQALPQAVRGDARRQFLDAGFAPGSADVPIRGDELRKRVIANSSGVYFQSPMGSG
jgi:hypothetical protein